MGPKLGGFFCHFLKFGSLVLLEISYNDSLQQCIASRTGDTHKKNLGTKIGPRIGFFVIFSSLVYQISWKLHGMIAWNIIELLLEVTPIRKIEGGGSKLDLKLRFLPFSQGCIISFP